MVGYGLTEKGKQHLAELEKKIPEATRKKVEQAIRETTGARGPEMHILKFEVPDVLHGDVGFEVQITIGHYRTVATLIINGKVVAQTFEEKWNNRPR